MEKQNSKNREKKDGKLIYQPKTLTKEQYKVISYQQQMSLCLIITKTSKIIGFLCNIPEPVLVSTSHSLDEIKIRPGEQIRICFRDENENIIYKTITIDEKRTIYNIGKLDEKEINTTIIELRLDEDKLEAQQFMEIDKKLMTDAFRNEYENKEIYLINYKEEEKKLMFSLVL